MDEDPVQTDNATQADHVPDESRFTIHDYYNPPAAHRQLRKLPRLLWLSIVVVWRSAARQFVTSALLSVLSYA